MTLRLILGWLFALTVATLPAAPSAEQQANYVAFQQGVVAAINAYRVANGNLPALTPITELAQAAREQAESALFQGSSDYFDAIDRAYELGYSGGGPAAFSGSGFFSTASLVAGVSADAGIRDSILDSEFQYIGVGFAAKAAENTGNLGFYVLLGRGASNPSAPVGTSGPETTSGRGLPAIASLTALYNGSLTGDSVNGFAENSTTGGLPESTATSVTKTIQRLLRKPLEFRLKKGENFTYELPEIVTRYTTVKVDGELPPGIKWKKKGLRGKARKTGSFRKARLIVELPFSIGAKETVTVKLRFQVR